MLLDDDFDSSSVNRIDSIHLGQQRRVRVIYALLDKLVTNLLILSYSLEQLLPQAGQSD